jgi:hypothetical protein
VLTGLDAREERRTNAVIAEKPGSEMVAHLCVCVCVCVCVCMRICRWAESLVSGENARYESSSPPNLSSSLPPSLFLYHARGCNYMCVDSMYMKPPPLPPSRLYVIIHVCRLYVPYYTCIDYMYRSYVYTRILLPSHPLDCM